MLSKLDNQKSYKIGNVEIGGNIGENPCLLIGSIFYWSHKIVEDPKKGVFNSKEAEELINIQDSLSDETGVNCAYDVVAQTAEAMERFIDFVSAHTENPIIIDAVPEKVRVHGAKYVKEVGLEKRAIYNSIAPWTRESEISALREIEMDYGIVFTSHSDPKKVYDLTVNEKMNILQDLLKKAENAGIKNLLVDVQSLSISDLGSASIACLEVKKRFGLPSGFGTGNGVTVWKEPRKWSDLGIESVDAAVNAVAGLLYSDFIFYGPIEKAKWVFPAIAVTEIIKTDLAKTTPRSHTHPTAKFFPELIEKERV